RSEGPEGESQGAPIPRMEIRRPFLRGPSRPVPALQGSERERARPAGECEARRRRTMVGEQIRGTFAQSKGGDLRAERVMIPQHFRAEDVRVVFQVAIEVRGADVEVEELAERGGHASACGAAAIRLVPPPARIGTAPEME